MSCLHSFRTDDKLKNHEKVCNNHCYCYVEIPSEYNKILKYNQGEKTLKSPFIIYNVYQKKQPSQNNPEK